MMISKNVHARKKLTYGSKGANANLGLALGLMTRSTSFQYRGNIQIPPAPSNLSSYFQSPSNHCGEHSNRKTKNARPHHYNLRSRGPFRENARQNGEDGDVKKEGKNEKNEVRKPSWGEGNLVNDEGVVEREIEGKKEKMVQEQKDSKMAMYIHEKETKMTPRRSNHERDKPSTKGPNVSTRNPFVSTCEDEDDGDVYSMSHTSAGIQQKVALNDSIQT